MIPRTVRIDADERVSTHVKTARSPMPTLCGLHGNVKRTEARYTPPTCHVCRSRLFELFNEYAIVVVTP